jgi:hypothetical protein
VWFLRQVKASSRRVGLVVATLACGTVLSADTLVFQHAVGPDRLFDPSLVSASVSASEFPTIGADLLLRADEPRDLLAFAAFPTDASSLNLLAAPPDDPAENGAKGVRRFIVLSILFGAVLRFLTSAAFYAWAADVFDPLDGY